MILITADAYPNFAVVVRFLQENRDFQQLVQSLGGWHVVFNFKDKQQVSEGLQTVEKLGMQYCGMQRLHKRHVSQDSCSYKACHRKF